LVAVSDEQYKSIPDDEIALLVRMFHVFTSSIRRGGDHLGATSSVATPPTSSPTTPRGRSLTPPTGTTTTSGAIIVRMMTRRSTTSGTRIIRRSSRR
jgi:hypothetical protein